MFQAFQNLGISSKLRVVIVASSVFTLLLASVSVLTFQWWNIRQEVSRDLLVQSQILASNSTAALKFQDEKAAAEMLAALKANPHVLSGSLFQSDGKLLARHGDATSSPAKLSAGMVDGLRFQGSHVEMLHSVVFEGKRIGALYLRFDYRAMERAILLPFLLIMGGIFAAASLAALALAAALHPLISNPIARLTKAALAVADKRDYSVRVEKVANDETGLLTGAFNQMLEQIHMQDVALKRSQQKLEALINSIDGIVWESNPNTFRFTFVSRQSERFLGYRAEQWLADPNFWQAHLHPEDVGMAVEIGRQSVARLQPYRYEYRMIAADGRTVWIRECGSLLVEDGQPVSARGIFLDVSAQKQAAEELDRLNRNLVDASRRAGMAEVATGILHNVGNVLNSVNVSCNIVLDRIQHSGVTNLPKLAAMLEAQGGNLVEFLTHDPKGREIPGYLCALAPVLVEEQAQALAELRALREKIDHIKEIVAMQQTYARRSGIIETLSIVELVEDALTLNAGALGRHDIAVVREFDPVPPIATDRHKILQILHNLIRNAKYACDEGGREPKIITVRVFISTTDRIGVQIIDNGVGIPSENLGKIFTHGFTTRKEGHGFGLHSGALAASEIGGTLAGESAGPGKGATFTLELPCQR